MCRTLTAFWYWINGFDTHDNLLKSNAIYREIYESQMQGGGDFDQPA